MGAFEIDRFKSIQGEHARNIKISLLNHFKEFNNKLRAVVRKFSKKAHREKILSKESELIPIGTLAIAVPFQFKNMLEIPNI